MFLTSQALRVWKMPSEIHKLHGKLLTRRPARREKPVEYQDGRSRLRRYAQRHRRGIDIDTRRESLIDRGIGWKTLLAYNGTIWGDFTLRGSGLGARAMAWIESPGLCRLYKSACCCFSFFLSFFSSCALSMSPDRSIDRSLSAVAGDPGSRVNVGRTCVSAGRAPLRSMDKKSEHDSPPSSLPDLLLIPPPPSLIARTTTSKLCAGVCEAFLRA